MESVRRQSLSNIEIIVIDDGSRDGTRAVAQRLAAGDQRIRIISMSNGGVAAARNAGIEAAEAVYVAPIDADDLWHPEKLARQLAILEARPEVSLVYSSRRNIDETGLVTKTIAQATLAGRVCHRLTAFNAVGNGSAIMFRRSDALRAGGYDSRLKAAGAQGCEDFLFQIRLATMGEVAVDGDYLVGYRKRANAMSNDDRAMLRSRLLALDIVARELPELAQTAREAQQKHQFLFGLKLLAAGEMGQAWALLGDWAQDANLAALRDGVGYLLHRRASRDPGVESSARRPFTEYQSGEAAVVGLGPHLRRVLAALEPRDMAFSYEQKVLQGTTG